MHIYTMQSRVARQLFLSCVYRLQYACSISTCTVAGRKHISMVQLFILYANLVDLTQTDSSDEYDDDMLPPGPINLACTSSRR